MSEPARKENLHDLGLQPLIIGLCRKRNRDIFVRKGECLPKLFDTPVLIPYLCTSIYQLLVDCVAIEKTWGLEWASSAPDDKSMIASITSLIMRFLKTHRWNGTAGPWVGATIPTLDVQTGLSKNTVAPNNWFITSTMFSNAVNPMINHHLKSSNTIFIGDIDFINHPPCRGR